MECNTLTQVAHAIIIAAIPALGLYIKHFISKEVASQMKKFNGED